MRVLDPIEKHPLVRNALLYIYIKVESCVSIILDVRCWEKHSSGWYKLKNFVIYTNFNQQVWYSQSKWQLKNKHSIDHKTRGRGGGKEG